MARVKTPLTARSIQTITKPGLHGDGGGLYLHVAVSGAKSWVFRWSRDGRSRDMGLGTAGDKDVTLKMARDLAAKARQVVREGRDPIAERNATKLQKRLDAAKAMTFRQCGEAYIKSKGAEWRNPKHAAQWPSSLSADVYPILGDLPVQAVDVGLVMKALEPIWTTKPETASRVRGRIEAVLDWAKARGYRQGENPARWRGHLENLLSKRSKVQRVQHHPALPYDEIATFIAELRKQEGIAARALEFTILTAARTGEAIGARWDEIDFAERLWTVPGERMKAGKEHRVPLSDAALAILDEMQKVHHSDFVFPGQRVGRPLSVTAMLKVLIRMGRADLTVHGFRAAFTDWAAERTNFPAEVREMALAHTVSDKVEAAYRRGDLFEKRRQLAEAWARFCEGPPAETENNVIAIGWS
jgi:integrase